MCNIIIYDPLYAYNVYRYIHYACICMYTYMPECMYLFISTYISVCQDTTHLENKERSC